MVKQLLFGILGLVAGFAIFVLGFILTEGFSFVAYPFPEGFKYTHEEICAHVAEYPDWVLGAVVGTWGLTALLASWMATRVGGRLAGLLISLVVGYLFICNVLMLPYPRWFVVAECISIPVFHLLGLFLGPTRKVSATNSPAAKFAAG